MAKVYLGDAKRRHDRSVQGGVGARLQSFRSQIGSRDPSTSRPARAPDASGKSHDQTRYIIGAYFETVQLAGFTEAEAKRFFGAPPRGMALTLKPQPTAQVEEAFLKRFRGMLGPA
jgi:hypothetical protein